MHLVLPYLDRDSARAAFAVACVLASRLKAPLHVLADDTRLAAAGAMAREATPAACGQPVVEAYAGDPVEAIVGKVSDPMQALVILGMRVGETAPEDTPPALMDVGRKMLEKTLCPILVVPPDCDMSGWQLRRGLLPQDGTPSCAAALAHIIRRSAGLGIEYLVLRVAGAHVGQPTEPGSLPTPRYVDQPQYEWEAWGREFLERVHGFGAFPEHLSMRLLMANGEPADAILRVAQENGVDMIILPWHRVLRSGRARMVKAVLRQAPCPVLLVPQLAERRHRRR